MGSGNFHLTRLDIAIDDKNEMPYFTIEQIKRKCLKATSRFWERFLGAVKPLKLGIEKPESSLQETQKWLMEGGTLSAVKAFLFLEKYNALGSLKDVQEMMNGAGYSVMLKNKLPCTIFTKLVETECF